jgi:flagellar biosynthesis/type III secretory pathway protein FliH
MRFPTSAELAAIIAGASSKSSAGASEIRDSEANARGYADGLARGRADAAAELAATSEQAQREGFDAGIEQGRERAATACGALGQAIEEMDQLRSEFAEKTESFAVDLAIAAASRLAEIDKFRAEFVRRAVADAIKTLAPAVPERIFINPDDLKLIGRDLGRLPIRSDDSIARGAARVEAGALLAYPQIENAIAQVASAILETRARRVATSRRAAKKRK